MFKSALALSIVAFLIWRLDANAVGRTLATIPALAIVCAELAILGQSILSAKRLVIVVERFGVRVGFWESCKITLEVLQPDLRVISGPRRLAHLADPPKRIAYKRGDLRNHT